MNKKRLGKTDMHISPVGLGCMGLSHAYGTALPEYMAIDFIQRAYDYGYDFFDTAEAYLGRNSDGSLSNNEKIIGKAIKDFRDDIVIASKFGVRHMGDHLNLDSSPETIFKSVEGTLQRLQIDCLDLYYQHRIDPKVEPETVAGVMGELIDEGKIKAWGISECNEEYLRRANDVCHVSAIQNRYSMIARDWEKIFPVCEELGITFIAFSPMANGFLSGSYDKDSKFDESDFRNFMPQYTPEGFDTARELIDLLGGIGDSHDASRSQISLSWMISKKDYIIPIPGTTKIENMRSNFDAGKIKLTKSEIDEIDSLLLQIDVPVFGGNG